MQQEERNHDETWSRKEEQEELEDGSEFDLATRQETAYLTASSVRFVFLCGIAYLLMTVWRAGAEKTPRQSEEGGGELLDIPGWRLATAQGVPTDISKRFKKSFCEMVNALLVWYLNSNLESNNSANREAFRNLWVSTPCGTWSKRQGINLRTEKPKRWRSDVLTKDHPVQGQADTEERVNEVSDKESSQASMVATECGVQRSKNSWDEAETKDSFDMTSTQDDVTGIATMESLQGKEILINMAVWRSGQAFNMCGPTAATEARIMAKEEDY